MAYITRTIEEIQNDPMFANSDVKLCYIDAIPETIWSMREEIKEKYKFLEDMPYEQWKDEYWKYPEYKSEELPNPDYIKGEQEMYAYFTPIPLEVQNGDDWNDVPYEHNASEPYDDIVVETEEKNGVKFVTKTTKHIIVKVPFAVKSFSYKIPRDYGHYNSPFSVDMINMGAVAWIFDECDGKRENMTSIYAGVNMYEFINKLKRIEEKNPDYKTYDEED
jgi:hypothetical protein